MQQLLRVVRSTIFAISLAVGASAQIADVPPPNGICPGTCTSVSGGSNLSRHCFKPNGQLPACGTVGTPPSPCQCYDVIGDAYYVEGELRGAFHECYCLPQGSTAGPKKSCSGYYEWHVHEVPGFAPSPVHRFEILPDPASFVHIFDNEAVQPNGTLAQSMVLTQLNSAISGYATFEETGIRTSTPGVYLWKLTGVDIQIGGFPLLTYMSGSNHMVLRQGSPVVCTYDSINETINSVVDFEVGVKNLLFPTGLGMAVELEMKKLNGEWYAHGRARLSFPLEVSHSYDSVNQTVTVDITHANPGSLIVLGIGASCLADVNRDNGVDDLDLEQIKLAYGTYTVPGESPCDINYDAEVDDADYLIAESQIGCMDGGTYQIPGCTYPANIPNPLTVVLVADASGAATFTVPTTGLAPNAFFVQAVEIAACEVSNLARVAVY